GRRARRARRSRSRRKPKSSRPRAQHGAMQVGFGPLFVEATSGGRATRTQIVPYQEKPPGQNYLTFHIDQILAIREKILSHKWQLNCSAIHVATQSTSEPTLCEALLPDGNGGRCIRGHGHPGVHQTFTSEWMEGASVS